LGCWRACSRARSACESGGSQGRSQRSFRTRRRLCMDGRKRSVFRMAGAGGDNSGRPADQPPNAPFSRFIALRPALSRDVSPPPHDRLAGMARRSVKPRTKRLLHNEKLRLRASPADAPIGEHAPVVWSTQTWPHRRQYRTPAQSRLRICIGIMRLAAIP